LPLGGLLGLPATGYVEVGGRKGVASGQVEQNLASLRVVKTAREARIAAARGVEAVGTEKDLDDVVAPLEGADRRELLGLIPVSDPGISPQLTGTSGAI